MLTLSDIAWLLVLVAGGAWLWHGHGVRERALTLASQHCKKFNLELLDGNVAFVRYSFSKDARGHTRFARTYSFEFTVTGEQRLSGRMLMFGKQLGSLTLDPHPFTEPSHAPAKVIDLQSWRDEHSQRL